MATHTYLVTEQEGDGFSREPCAKRGLDLARLVAGSKRNEIELRLNEGKGGGEMKQEVITHNALVRNGRLVLRSCRALGRIGGEHSSTFLSLIPLALGSYA